MIYKIKIFYAINLFFQIFHFLLNLLLINQFKNYVVK